MKIIGLTGGIASGKNFVAAIFEQRGAAIFDADAEVHKLLELDKEAILAVKKSFPESFVEGKISRKILGKIVFSNSEKLKILEKILHERVRKKYSEFLELAANSQKKIVLLNIPLLLESEGYKCDQIVAITTSPSIQKRRFLTRERKKNPQNFSAGKKNLEQKFEQIRAKQIANKERKAKADFVINSSHSKAETKRQVEKFIKDLF